MSEELAHQEPVAPVAPPVVEPTPKPVATQPESAGRLRLRGLIVIIVVLLVGLGIGGAATYFYLNDSSSSNNQAASSTPTPTPSTSPTPTPDPYAEWKTYESEEFDVAFKYPSDWQIDDASTYEDLPIIKIIPDSDELLSISAVRAMGCAGPQTDEEREDLEANTKTITFPLGQSETTITTFCGTEYIMYLTSDAVERFGVYLTPAVDHVVGVVKPVVKDDLFLLLKSVTGATVAD